MSILPTIWRLPFADKWLLLQVIILLVAMILALKVLPFRLVSRCVTALRKREIRRRGKAGPSAERAAWAVNRVSSRIPAANCLAKALTTLVLLGRFGQPGSLRFAVARGTKGKLEAHAWVENNNRVLIGQLADLSRFVVLSPSKEIKL